MFDVFNPAERKGGGGERWPHITSPRVLAISPLTFWCRTLTRPCPNVTFARRSLVGPRVFSGPLSRGVGPLRLEICRDNSETIVPSPLEAVFVRMRQNRPGPQYCHRSAPQMGLLRNAGYFQQKKKQTADVPCVLHAHCSPDVGPMKINTCEGPLSLWVSKLFHFLDSEGVTAGPTLVVISFTLVIHSNPPQKLL